MAVSRIDYDTDIMGQLSAACRTAALELSKAENLLERWLAGHPDGIVICDEVGCGVVPMDREDRSWRERVGRTCCRLAERASAVYRVTCGLGVRLK